MLIHLFHAFIQIQYLVYDENTKIVLFLSQVQLTSNTMMKKGKKKPKIVENDSYLEMEEVVPMKKVDIVYEDTKSITRVPHAEIK